MAHADRTDAKRRIMYCSSCGKKTNHSSGLAEVAWKLTVITLGLFMPVWLLLHFFGRHWQCKTCGKRRRSLRSAQNPF